MLEEAFNNVLVIYACVWPGCFQTYITYHARSERHITCGFIDIINLKTYTPVQNQTLKTPRARLFKGLNCSVKTQQKQG